MVVPRVWGNRYSVVTEILRGDVLPMTLAALLVAKLIATAATVGSGAIGGILTPTLFIGAAVGGLAHAAWSQLFPGTATTPGAFALVGMGGLLPATTHAPLTAILMVLEITLDYDVVLSLMLACVSAHYTARTYRGARSVYFEVLHPVASVAARRTPSVGELAPAASATCRADASVAAVLHALPKRPIDALFVLDVGGRLEGSVHPHALLERVERQQVDPSARISQVADVVPAFLTPEMTLTAALDMFLRERADVLPLVAGACNPLFLGEVTRTDLALALQDELAATRSRGK